MLACIARRCLEPSYTRGFCRGHYARVQRAEKRGESPDLSPLRAPDAPARVVLSLRVSPDAKARASEDPEGARAILERWAKR